MKCPEIRHIQFDEASIRAIESIRRETNKLNIADTILRASAPILIFFRSDSLSQAWNFSQFDWNNFRQAVQSIDAIKRNRIMSIATQQQLRVMTYDERAFWEAVASGCE